MANIIIAFVELVLSALLKNIYTTGYLHDYQKEAIVLYSNICAIVGKMLRGRSVRLRILFLNRIYIRLKYPGMRDLVKS